MEDDNFSIKDKKENYETCSTETISSYISINEKCQLIENEINDDNNDNRYMIFNKISSSLIAMLQGVEVLCNLSIIYLLKDNYHLHPASLNIVMCFIKIPWSLKLVWAVISDNYPIFGYRRKYYLLLGSFLCIISLICLGLINHNNLFITILLLFIYFFGSSLCNVIGEAQVVESNRNCSINCSAKNVSLFFAFRKLSFAIMSYLSGYLLIFISKKHIFFIGSFLPICVFTSGFFIIEKRKYTQSSIKEQIKCIYGIIKLSYIKNFIIFIFIMMSTPSCGNTLFFYITNELKFSPNLLGKMTMFQSLASFISIIIYMLFFTKIDIKKLLLYSTIIITPFCLLPLVVIKKLNNFLFIPNTLFFITDTILIEFIAEFQTMPILVLCSRLIPEGFESTIYSLLLSSNNFASIISSFLSSLLTYSLHITSTNFTNLPYMIIICCLTNIIPIFFLYILPNPSKKKNLQQYNSISQKYYSYPSTDYISSQKSDSSEITKFSTDMQIDDITLE
ncbi:folate transporter 1 [Plasmodium sp. DRC-Itaito]|nr:folate transporter 1 [Plasmodium sp. DRC-Itaito]